MTRIDRNVCICSALLVTVGLTGQVHSQQSDLEHIRTLREKGSYAEIDAYCHMRLAETDLSDAVAVDITVAWLRASTQLALEAPLDEQPRRWNRLSEIAALSERARQSSRGILIQIQLTLADLLRVRTLWEEASAKPANNDFETVRSLIRGSIGQLKTIDRSLTELLHQKYKKSASAARKSGWTRDELESLRRNLAVQKARAYRYQALCYPRNSPDRINSLGLALESLDDLINSSSNGETVWDARIEQLVCLRLLKRYAEARALLEEWRTVEPPLGIASRLRSEAMRLALAEGGVSSQSSTESHIDDSDILLHSAASLYEAGKLQEAIRAYDLLGGRFAAAGDKDRQFEAKETAAAIVRAAGEQGEASERFRQLSLDQPKHARAARTHLAATGLAANLLRKASTEHRPAATNRYVSMLQEHLRLWPQSKEAEAVRHWLGRHWIARREWSKAFEIVIDSSTPAADVADYLVLAKALEKNRKFEQVKRLVEAAQGFDKDFPQPTLQDLERHKANALARLGDREQALEIYRRLLESDGEGSATHERLATLLSEGNQPEEFRSSLQIWRQIEKHSKPGGPRWLRARQARLELLERLGKGEQAEKLLQLTRILYPHTVDVLDSVPESDSPIE